MAPQVLEHLRCDAAALLWGRGRFNEEELGQRVLGASSNAALLDGLLQARHVVAPTCFREGRAGAGSAAHASGDGVL
eukprot:11879794-Alexandrium_andersonii.AAC.1